MVLEAIAEKHNWYSVDKFRLENEKLELLRPVNKDDMYSDCLYKFLLLSLGFAFYFIFQIETRGFYPTSRCATFFFSVRSLFSSGG
jgi:hypothetical protein